nr:MAG TPA: hypothetical protein [Caudoviricetes sp.]
MTRCTAVLIKLHDCNGLLDSIPERQLGARRHSGNG